jgi:cbb3-type cytochrome oxidase maturation protein
MTVLYVILPLALVLAAAALWAFYRCLCQGQFDDLDTPPVRALHDD